MLKIVCVGVDKSDKVDVDDWCRQVRQGWCWWLVCWLNFKKKLEISDKSDKIDVDDWCVGVDKSDKVDVDDWCVGVEDSGTDLTSWSPVLKSTFYYISGYVAFKEKISVSATELEPPPPPMGWGLVLPN